MAISGTITLLTASTNMSSFDLYSCTSSNGASCSGTAFETNVTRSQLLNGFVSNSIPDGTTYIKINPTSAGCLNQYIIVELSGVPTCSFDATVVYGLPSVTPTPTSTPTPTPTSTGLETTLLSWTFSINNSPSSPFMVIYVNGNIIEDRSYDSFGTWTVNVGDVIYVDMGASGCSGFNGYANVYTVGIISDASCAQNTTSFSSTSYTVTSEDIGNILNLYCYADCNGGCN